MWFGYWLDSVWQLQNYRYTYHACTGELKFVSTKSDGGWAPSQRDFPFALKIEFNYPSDVPHRPDIIAATEYGCCNWYDHWASSNGKIWTTLAYVLSSLSRVPAEMGFRISAEYRRHGMAIRRAERGVWIVCAVFVFLQNYESTRSQHYLRSHLAAVNTLKIKRGRAVTNFPELCIMCEARINQCLAACANVFGIRMCAVHRFLPLASFLGHAEFACNCRWLTFWRVTRKGILLT